MKLRCYSIQEQQAQIDSLKKELLIHKDSLNKIEINNTLFISMIQNFLINHLPKRISASLGLLFVSLLFSSCETEGSLSGDWMGKGYQCLSESEYLEEVLRLHTLVILLWPEKLLVMNVSRLGI